MIRNVSQLEHWCEKKATSWRMSSPRLYYLCYFSLDIDSAHFEEVMACIEMSHKLEEIHKLEDDLS